MSESDSTGEAAPPRKRGRPAGVKGKTTQADDRLQSTDFHFLRAVIQGIDHKDAAERYLAQRGPMDRRSAVAYEKRLRRVMQRAIKVLRDCDEAQRQLDNLNAPVAVASIGPSLEEFARRFDEDMYSEAELIELYQDEYGDLPGSGGRAGAHQTTLKAKLQALSWLHERLAVLPTENQPVDFWIERGIADQVRAHGVLTLADLVVWINLTGRRWYDKLAGVGRRRAERLLIFLLQNEEPIGRRLSDRVRFALKAEYRLVPDVPAASVPGAGETALVDVAGGGADANDVQTFGIVPLESLKWPVELLGAHGEFRNLQTNTYRANNDREAIQAWCETLKEKSPATQDSYRRAVERLVLWAVVERGIALSDLSTNDFAEFRNFLRNPPAHWCSRFPVMRFSKEWRPFRGKLADASVQQTMSAVATLYSDLLTCGYLRTNAVDSVRSSKRQEFRMDVGRSFAVQDLDSIRQAWEEMPAGPARRRLRAIILLLQTSGVRRGEATHMTWGQVEPARLNNLITSSWVVKFIGKGNKERIVPIQEATYRALQDHLDDRKALIVAGVLPYSDMSLKDTPLLSVLDERQTHSKGGAGDTPSDAARFGNPTGALSAGRLHGILKGFFRKVASRPGLIAGQADFFKASAHWLRHTFAHQALAGSNRDLPAVQQILGHADIGTTGIYVKADMASRVAAVESVKGAL